MDHNRRLVLEGRSILMSALQQPSPVPDEMIGSMATLRLPVPGPELGSAFDVDPLQTELFEKYRVEVPIFAFPAPGARCLRISAQVYNHVDEYRSLARALTELVA